MYHNLSPQEKTNQNNPTDLSPDMIKEMQKSGFKIQKALIKPLSIQKV